MTPPENGWELIVADNGSTDSTQEVLRSFLTILPLAIVSVAKPGKSRALNAGISQATGELLVFSDDDVRPREDWLSAMAEAMGRHPAATVFGGRILTDHAVVPRWILHSYNLHEMLLSEHDLGDTELTYPAGRYPIGPNMAVRRSALVGLTTPWPADMGPGTRLPLGDERAFLSQVSHCDAEDRIYVPSAVVEHDVEPSQVRFGGALWRCFQGGWAAGTLGVRFPCPQPTGTGVVRVMLERARACSSAREAGCMGLRATGVALGSLMSRIRQR